MCSKKITQFGSNNKLRGSLKACSRACKRWDSMDNSVVRVGPQEKMNSPPFLSTHPSYLLGTSICNGGNISQAAGSESPRTLLNGAPQWLPAGAGTGFLVQEEESRWLRAAGSAEHPCLSCGVRADTRPFLCRQKEQTWARLEGRATSPAAALGTCPSCWACSLSILLSSPRLHWKPVHRLLAGFLLPEALNHLKTVSQAPQHLEINWEKKHLHRGFFLKKKNKKYVEYFSWLAVLCEVGLCIAFHFCRLFLAVMRDS